MHREDNSNYLLYIEPPVEEKLKEPIEDEWTELMELALSEAIGGVCNYYDLNCGGKFYEGGGYRGCHYTACKTPSSNKDYLLKNELITNSLATFYLKWYRDSIPHQDWYKLTQLKRYYDKRNN